ncbi:hypothetical protein D6783_04710 [Candidatus Woesearchaeota archaeon]|nr:MAG: hypothetical protein D6783_04710 [Candidatus Woesearchaeota archaeon]
MDACVVTDPGLERLACQEVERLVGGDPVVKKGMVFFRVQSAEEAVLFAYRSLLARRVLLVVGRGSVREGVHSVVKNIEWKVLKALVKDGETFAVRCERFGLYRFGTMEAQEIVGGAVKKELRGVNVSLSNPDVLLFLWICDGEAVLGVDVVKVDLSKRAYRVFLGSDWLKGSLASGVLELAEVKEGEVFLDPFCGAGTLCIEAALRLSGRSPRRYQKDLFVKGCRRASKEVVQSLLDAVDKKEEDAKDPCIFGFDSRLSSVSAARKNAKIAGVQKRIAISKVDVEWIDLKFDEGGVDVIATCPPRASRLLPESKIEVLYNELFHQARYALSSKGRVCVVTSAPDHLKKHAQARGFALRAEVQVWSGKQELWLLLWEKRP